MWCLGVWDVVTVVLRGIALSTFIRKEEKLKINELSVQFNLEKGKQNKSNERIINIWAEVNDIENKDKIERIKQAKCWFFKKTNKTKGNLLNWFLKIR